MLIIGSDHSGIELKNKIIKYLDIKNVKKEDVTNFECQDNDDYPDIANIICNKVLQDSNNLGIAICGTGIGISISCNKIKGIRAALCTDEYMSKMSRVHNNANVLCLGARLDASKEFSNIQRIVDAFLENEFESGRHEIRIEKITELENNSKKVVC